VVWCARTLWFLGLFILREYAYQIGRRLRLLRLRSHGILSPTGLSQMLVFRLVLVLLSAQ
jgi:hypothetical protein